MDLDRFDAAQAARRLALSFAIAASLRNGCPVSRRYAARYVSQRAASSSVAMSASLNWIAWNFAIGWPNCTRAVGVVRGQVEHGLGQAERQRGDRDAPDLERAQELAEPHRRIADEVLVGHPDVVEEQLAGVEAPPADAPHLRAHGEAGRVLLHDEGAVPRLALGHSVRASSVTPNDMSVPAFEMKVFRPLISQPPSRRSARYGCRGRRNRRRAR